MVSNGVEQTQILITQSESELLVLFREDPSSLGIKTETVSSGQEAIYRFLKSKEKKNPYDAVVLDTHLYDTSGLEVAKRIHSQKPDQKIVLVTTTPKENLKQECLKTAEIKDKDILIMPFRMSKLRIALEG